MNTSLNTKSSTNLHPNVEEIDPAVIERLHASLVAKASDQRLLDIAYRTLDSPVGELLLATTEQGLVRVAFAREGHDRVLEILAARISPRIMRAPHKLDAVARALEHYFAGERMQFKLPVDMRLVSGFRRDILALLPTIGYGQTVTYATLAAHARNPKAVRALGTACATNPLPIVVPCHRVVRSDGGLGGYIGGLDAKQLLLSLEAA